jgi:ABC-type glutathione transport system ATPase component
MSKVQENSVALYGKDIRKSFRRESGETVVALNGVSLSVNHGTLTALVGPDGAGKTTLIRLVTGLLLPDSGEMEVLGFDVSVNPQQVQDRIGYMPQRFGLYEDLTVQENLNLYADLHGVSREQRREGYPRLMEMTALGPFTDRLAGQLSGGMKQKLGLACTLVRSPARQRARPYGVCQHVLSRRSRALRSCYRLASGKFARPRIAGCSKCPWRRARIYGRSARQAKSSRVANAFAR